MGTRASLALAMTPFLLAHFGQEGYGLIGLASVIVGLADLADLGLRSALGRELAQETAHKNIQAFNELTSTALLLYSCMAAAVALIGWTFAPWLVSFLKVPGYLSEDAIWIIRAYGSLSVILSFVTPVFAAALFSSNRFDIVNSIQAIGSILSNLLLLAVLPMTPNPLSWWVGVILGSQLCTLVLMIMAFTRNCSGARIGLKYINTNRLACLFHLGGYLYVIQLAQTLSDKADPLILSFFNGPSAVALYQPAMRLSMTVNPAIMTLTSQLYPLVTKYHANGSEENIKQILYLGTKYTLLPGALTSAGVFVFAEPFARLWLSSSLGSDYLIVAVLMKIYSILDLLTYTGGAQWPVLLGMKKLGFLACLLICTAILNIALSVFFVGYTNAGITGVLYGTLISKAIRVVVLNVYMTSQLNIRVTRYLKQSVVGPLGGLLVSALTGFFLLHNFACDSWRDLFGMVLLTTFAWAVFCWCIGFDQGDRNRLLSAVRRLALPTKVF